MRRNLTSLAAMLLASLGCLIVADRIAHAQSANANAGKETTKVQVTQTVGPPRANLSWPSAWMPRVPAFFWSAIPTRIYPSRKRSSLFPSRAAI